MDWDTPKPHTDTDQKMDFNKLAFSRLQMGQSHLKEEPVDFTDSLIPPLTTKALEKMEEKNDRDELSKVEKKQQQKEEKYTVYQKMYKGQLSEEEESNTESDNSGYSYFGCR